MRGWRSSLGGCGVPNEAEVLHNIYNLEGGLSYSSMCTPSDHRAATAPMMLFF